MQRVGRLAFYGRDQANKEWVLKDEEVKSSSLPHQPSAQSDEEQSGEPLLKSCDLGIAAQQLAQRAAGVRDGEVHQRSADVKDQAEHQDLQEDAAAVSIDKLR